MLKNYNEDFERGSNTKDYWAQKHVRQYKLDEPFDFSNIEAEKRSYNYIGSKLIIENKESFKQKSILEIGCGNGYFSAYIKSQLPDWYVEAWDFSPVAIESAKQKAPEVTFVERDFILNPINIDFGTICIFETIEHIEEGLNYKILDNILDHCEYCIVSTVNTRDDCFGEHISHYTFDTFEEKGYKVEWKSKLAEIDMHDGQQSRWYYMIFLIKGKL